MGKKDVVSPDEIKNFYHKIPYIFHLSKQIRGCLIFQNVKLVVYNFKTKEEIIFSISNDRIDGGQFSELLYRISFFFRTYTEHLAYLYFANFKI